MQAAKKDTHVLSFLTGVEIKNELDERRKVLVLMILQVNAKLDWRNQGIQTVRNWEKLNLQKESSSNILFRFLLYLPSVLAQKEILVTNQAD